VILQQVVGTLHGERFYPDFSGVVRSHNFYPVEPMTFSDGIAAVALGLGRTVVDGGKSISFCPRFPRNLLQFSSVEDILANTQTEFCALELAGVSHADVSHEVVPHEGGAGRLREAHFGLEVAERDGTLDLVASTYSADNHAVYDGMSRSGPRVVTFAPVLKHNLFPLAAILDQLVRAGEDALGNPVEIEFAVRLPRVDAGRVEANRDEPAEFGFLQIRPLTVARDHQDLAIGDVDPSQLICESSKVLGNGRIENLCDIVVVDSQRFERSRSQEVARAVAQFNARLGAENVPYLLIGVGRWGSNDPWLGIPVEWDEISGARVIVEAGFRDFRVTPSQGSHFFQNLTAFQVGYFTVNPDAGEGSIDWAWLTDQDAVDEQGCVRHLRLPQPMRVVMNSKTSRGVIFKPEGN